MHSFTSLVNWRNLLFAVFFGLLTLGHVYGQRGYSFSVGMGASYYYGDISAGFSNVFLRPAFTVNTGYYFTPSLSMRLGISYTTLGSADSLADDLGRRQRDLHFRNTITEISGILYYEFLPDAKFGYYYFNKPHFSPYIFAGVAIFGHSPKAMYEGKWTKLQPLGTEGQFLGSASYPEPYSLLQVAIPFGGGLNFRFSSNVAISLDLGYRKIFTDYLDDLSTSYPDFGQLAETGGPVAVALSDPSGRAKSGEKRGSASSKDSYLFGLVSLTLYLDKDGNY